MSDLGWQQQREIWNAENKCAREACRGPLQHEGRLSTWGRHKTTGLLYCMSCTRLLQKHQGDSVMEILPDRTLSEPCPHPDRGGKHELYAPHPSRTGHNKAYCRACGARDYRSNDVSDG